MTNSELSAIIADFYAEKTYFRYSNLKQHADFLQDEIWAPDINSSEPISMRMFMAGIHENLAELKETDCWISIKQRRFSANRIRSVIFLTGKKPIVFDTPFSESVFSPTPQPEEIDDLLKEVCAP